MADTRTTIEEARRCPKCGKTGRLSRTNFNADRSKIETYTCETEGCRWFNTGWAIQIMSDGTLAHRQEGRHKEFPASPALETLGRNTVKETEFIFGLDREPEDPEYGKQRDLKEIRKQF